MEKETERTTRYLEDLLAAERGLQEMLDGHAKDEKASASIRQICGEALAGSHSRGSLLELELGRYGEDPSGVKEFINKAATNLSDLWNSGHSPQDKLTMDLIKAHAGAHLVHGSYIALQGYSGSIGESELATLAEEGARTAKTSADNLVQPIYEMARAVSPTQSRPYSEA